MSEQKERENLLLHEVAEIYDDFPSDKIIASESPDFLISGESDTVGIELTDYIRGQGEQGSFKRRNEILWQQVANHARTIYEMHNSAPLLVHFFWHDLKHLKEEDLDELAQTAARLVKANIPDKRFERSMLEYHDLHESPLEGFLHALHITRVRNVKQSLWSFAAADFIDLQAEELQWLISQKNSKVPEYLTSCATVWLLIVADGAYLSSNISISEEITEHKYVSRFERILLYNRFDRKVLTLPVIR